MAHNTIYVTSNNLSTAYEPTQHCAAIDDKNMLSRIVISILKNVQEIPTKLRCLGRIIGANFSDFIDKIIYLYDSISSKFSNKLQDELAAACGDNSSKKITNFIKKHRIYCVKNSNNPIIRDGDSYVTALTLACRNGQINIVNKLLRFKKKDGTSFVDINAMPTGSTALTEAIQRLKDLQNDQNTADPDDQRLPTVSEQILEKAILNVIIRLINDRKIDLNKKDTDGFTPLMSACVNGQENIVEYLSKINTLTIVETIKILEKSLSEDQDRQAKKAIELLSKCQVFKENILFDNGAKIEPFDYICQNTIYTIIYELNRQAIPLKNIESGYEIVKKRAKNGAIDNQMVRKIESAFQSAYKSAYKSAFESALQQYCNPSIFNCT